MFTDLGPNTKSLATMDANGTPVLAVIERGALGPGSGPVVIMSDANAFVDRARSGFFPAHEALYLNIFKFLLGSK